MTRNKFCYLTPESNFGNTKILTKFQKKKKKMCRCKLMNMYKHMDGVASFMRNKCIYMT